MSLARASCSMAVLCDVAAAWCSKEEMKNVSGNIIKLGFASNVIIVIR